MFGLCWKLMLWHYSWHLLKMNLIVRFIYIGGLIIYNCIRYLGTQIYPIYELLLLIFFPTVISTNDIIYLFNFAFIILLNFSIFLLFFELNLFLLGGNFAFLARLNLIIILRLLLLKLISGNLLIYRINSILIEFVRLYLTFIFFI